MCAILLDFLEEFQNNNIIFMCVQSDSYTFSTMQSYSYFLPNILLCVYTVYIIYVQYMYMCVYTGIYIYMKGASLILAPHEVAMGTTHSIA